MATDLVTLGQRVKHFRRRAGMTLDQLGTEIKRPSSYLSLLENGKREPRLSLLQELAQALSVTVEELLDPEPPNRRAQLEIELGRLQKLHDLDLPQIKPSARLSDEVLTHLIGLYRHLDQQPSPVVAAEVRRANGELTRELTDADGYLAEIEAAASEAVARSGYSGNGPLSSRNLLDLVTSLGYQVRAVEDIPPSLRSITDLDRKVIYIPQRNELRTRQARKAILQTLAGFMLGHTESSEESQFLRQRRESAYFASAVLMPERALVPVLLQARDQRDLSVEDLRELFYTDYVMAAHRLANLATRHLAVRTHLAVSDQEGFVRKAYQNDGAPFPRDEEGGVEAQRLCREWSARAVFGSADRFALHYQFTDTPKGTFFCSTYVEPDGAGNAVTFGVRFADSKLFRGRDTTNHRVSGCPEQPCCRVPDPDLSQKWRDKMLISPRSQAAIVGLLTPDPRPRLDLAEIYNVLEKQ